MGESAKGFRVSAILRLPHPTAGADGRGATPSGRRSSALAIAAALVACVSMVSADAFAAHVRGAVTGYQWLLNPVWEEAKDPDHHGFSFREPVPTVRAEFRRLYPDIPKELCIAALSSTPQPAQKPILIRVGGGRTTPVTIVVTPGTQLQFQNTDPFPHRLYGVGIGTFLASDTVKGGIRTWSVPGPGTFEIRDEAAPSLRMWIIGEPNLAGLAYPSSKGEFALPIDAAGDYRVQAYFAGKKVGPEVPVKVGAGDVDLGKQPLKVADEKSEKSK
jgi:hypothetical protein